MSTAAITETAPPAAASPKVPLMSILLPVLLSTLLTLGAVGGGVYWLLKSGKLGGTAAPAAAPVPAGPPPVVIVAPPASHVLAMEPMIVNLADGSGRSYLRIAVSLRLRDEEKAEKKTEEKKDPKAVDGEAVALRDTTLNVLSRQTADQLLPAEGRESLKHALEQAYREHNPESRVMEIYFTDFLVQRG